MKGGRSTTGWLYEIKVLLDQKYYLIALTKYLIIMKRG